MPWAIFAQAHAHPDANRFKKSFESEIFGNRIEMEYEVSSLRKPESFADLGRDCLSLHHIFGFDVSRRENWCLIEPDKVLFASGSSVVIQNIKDGSRDYLLSIDDQGVGCITVHPSK